MDGLHAQYSRKAATQQALVAWATNDTTFHCQPGLENPFPSPPEGGGCKEGAVSAFSGGALNSQSKLGCSEQDVGLLVKNLLLLVPHG